MMTAVSPRRGVKPRRESMLALGVIVACLVAEAAALRVGIDDLDEGYFVQQALRVARGQVPYQDFQSLYTPGLAYVHAAIFGLVGGPYVLAPRVLALAARAGLALLLYVITRPLVQRPLWAALPALYMLVGLDDAPVRWEPHPAWLSTFFAVLAAWCASRGSSPRWLAAAGIAAGASYAFKQNTGAFIVAAIIVLGVVSPRGRMQRVVVPGVAFGAMTLAWLVPLVVELRGDVAPLGVLIGAVNQAGLFSAPEWPVLVPIGCLLGGLWLARRDSRGNGVLRWYLLAGSALSLTQYPRMDALHLVWSAPLLLVIGAITLDRLKPLLALPFVVGALALTGPTIASRVLAITQPTVPIAAIPYAAGIEVPERTRQDLQAVVTQIQERTTRNEPIFVYPTSPLLYTLSDRPNPTRFDHLNPGAATPQQIERVILDLEASHVRVVVISDFWQAAWGDPGPNAVLETWLAAHFTEVARHGGYRVLVSGL